MFDIGWQELFIIAIFALIVVGPKDLPRVIRSVTQALRKVKGMAREFQSGIDDVVREAELQDMRKELTKEGESFKEDLSSDFDPSKEISGEFQDELDFSKEQLDLELAANAEPDAPASTEGAIQDTASNQDAASSKADG